MRQLFVLILLVCALAWPHAPASSYTLQYTSQSATVQVRWPSSVINIALSNSLNAPPSNIEATPEQVVAAARRALKTWSESANIQFNVSQSFVEALDPNDGVSVITVSQVNAPQFSSPDQQGRARLRFDQNGQIQEGDVGVNPAVRFSTDGRTGTYDLESTFVHELGHLLGLEHSGVVGASMQPRQGQNGFYNLPAFTTRTLAHDDRAGVRAIYGPRVDTGALAGAVTYSNGQPAFGAHVWAEEVATGRVVGGNIALPNGAYRIDNIPPGSYRVMAEYLDEPVNAGQIASRSGAYAGLSTTTTLPFLTREEGTINIPAGDTQLGIVVNGASPFLNPTHVGANGQLSTVPVPLVPGRTATVYVGGNGVTDGSGAILATPSVNSPFMTVGNVQSFGLAFGIPVISFDVAVSAAAPPGEYSVRLQSGNEVAFVTGALVVDLPFGVVSGNPIDDTTFFAAQHYRDFFSREADAPGLQFWVNNIESCGADAACREVKKIDTSAAFFLSIEFQQTGYFVYRVHHASFATGERLRFRDFLLDLQRIGRGIIVGAPGWEQKIEANQQAYLTEFVERPEFLARYPRGTSPQAFVDALNQNAGGVLSQAERDKLVGELQRNEKSRAQILQAVADDPDTRTREFNRAFVLMQYFGYLRRNPDDPPDKNFDGFNFWLAKLNQFNGDYRAAEMVKAFIVSNEYRSRFGLP